MWMVNICLTCKTKFIKIKKKIKEIKRKTHEGLETNIITSRSQSQSKESQNYILILR